MSFEDRISEVVQGILSDSTQLPAEFISSLPQIVAQNPVPTAQITGSRLAYGITTANVSTAGTTFGTGADLLATALEFTAKGSNSYIIRVTAPAWTNTGASATNEIRLNLDGGDAGRMAVYVNAATNANSPLAAAALYQPSTGEHSVNVRLMTTAGTVVVQGNTGGGGGTFVPIIVTVEVA